MFTQIGGVSRGRGRWIEVREKGWIRSSSTPPRKCFVFIPRRPRTLSARLGGRKGKKWRAIPRRSRELFVRPLLPAIRDIKGARSRARRMSVPIHTCAGGALVIAMRNIARRQRKSSVFVESNRARVHIERSGNAVTRVSSLVPRCRNLLNKFGNLLAVMRV